MLRIVYFGTPGFAEPTLRTLAGNREFEVALVVSQPDRPSGRGQKLVSPPVAVAARDLGLPLYQPSSLRTAEARHPLVDVDADLFVVAAFGLIFGHRTLSIPRLGCVNLHASLLPKYRGASPILSAIAMGEQETGVTLMQMDVGLDTGDATSRVVVPIRPDDTTETLTAVLAGAGADLANHDLARFAHGELKAMPQPRGASVTRLLDKSDGWMDWTRPAIELERHVRAMWPWPRAWTTIGNETIQVHRASVGPETDLPPGAVFATKDALIVGCGAGSLVLEVVQQAGGKPMPGAALAAGLNDELVLGVAGDPGPRPPLVVPAEGTEGE